MKKSLIILAFGCIILVSIPFIVSAQGTLPYDSPCSSDSQCLSNFCEPRDGVLRCLCQENSHCPISAPVCNAITNTCYSGASPCTSNWQCETQYCFLGFCSYCALDSNCDAGRICVNGWCLIGGTPQLLEYGDYCDTNNECRSGYCDLGMCACRTDSDCPYQENNPSCENGLCVGELPTGNVNCWIVTSEGTEFSWQYDDEAECRSECQAFDCEEIYEGDCQGSCCLSQDRNSQNVSCPSTPAVSGSALIPNPLICDDVECIVQAIADLIAGLVVVIGTIMIIIGAIQYIMSAGNEDRARKAKNTVLYAIIGIAIAVSVDFIIGFLREILSGSN